jgi:hypothetical protein
MSRLDAHIAQKIAQRDGLDFAARRLAGRGGVIVEFGLGKGRSYSHLVERFPGREVFCFDRRDATHPGWGPPPDHLYLGEFADVLEDPAVHAAFAGRVLLAHLDLAFGESRDTRVHEFVVERIHPWLAPGGLLLSDRPLALRPGWGLARLQTAGHVAHAERVPVYERPAP